jgi:hypothetical protein
MVELLLLMLMPHCTSRWMLVLHLLLLPLLLLQYLWLLPR